MLVTYYATLVLIHVHFCFIVHMQDDLQSHLALASQKDGPPVAKKKSLVAKHVKSP